MIARQRSIGRTAAAVFLLFAAALGVTRAEASIPRAGDVERGLRASDTGRPPALTGATLTAGSEVRPVFPLGATLAPPSLGPSFPYSAAGSALALFPVFTPEPASGAGWKSRNVTQDELGNVTHLTDQSGSVVERYQYEGYGKARIFDPSNSPRTVSSFGWNRLFQGREHLGFVDAYDFRARVLWPEIGRFGQEDPERYRDSSNLYVALGAAWSRLTDPMGLFVFDSSCSTCSFLEPEDTKRKVREYLAKPPCQKLLKAVDMGSMPYHTFKRKGKEDFFGCMARISRDQEEPRVFCTEGTTSCGFTNTQREKPQYPAWSILLYKGDSACPRFYGDLASGKVKGFRDASQTLFHEALHYCGMPSDPGGMAADTRYWGIIEKCTGYWEGPPGSPEFRARLGRGQK